MSIPRSFDTNNTRVAFLDETSLTGVANQGAVWVGVSSTVMTGVGLLWRVTTIYSTKMKEKLI